MLGGLGEWMERATGYAGTRLLMSQDAFWCYVDEGTLQGCKAEQVKLLKDVNNRSFNRLFLI